MPRREGPKAEAAAAKAMESRWRYLLRNPEFRADLNERRRHSGLGLSAPAIDEKGSEFLFKWDLLGLPSNILKPDFPNLGPKTIKYYEPYFQFPIRNPVSAIDLFDAYPDRIVCTCDVEDLGSPPPGVLLEILVDLRNPRDLLMSLIEQELRKAQKRPRPRKRRHLDKVDSYLKVYDLAERGETFRAIAKTLKRPISTVKSAYLTAYKNIYGVSAKRTKKTLSKDTFDWKTFDSKEHYKTCHTCQKATISDEMCPPLRLHVTQEHRGQRASTGYDTLR